MTNKRHESSLRLTALGCYHYAGLSACLLPLEPATWLAGSPAGLSSAFLAAAENLFRLDPQLLAGSEGKEAWLVYEWRQTDWQVCVWQYQRAGQLAGRVFQAPLTALHATFSEHDHPEEMLKAAKARSIAVSPEWKGGEAWRTWLRGEHPGRSGKGHPKQAPFWQLRTAVPAALQAAHGLTTEKDLFAWKQTIAECGDRTAFPVVEIRQLLEPVRPDLMAWRARKRLTPEVPKFRAWLQQWEQLQREQQQLREEAPAVLAEVKRELYTLRQEQTQSDRLASQELEQLSNAEANLRLRLQRLQAQAHQEEPTAAASTSMDSPDWLRALSLWKQQLDQLQAIPAVAPEASASLHALRQRLRNARRQLPALYAETERYAQQVQQLRKDKSRATQTLAEQREAELAAQRAEKQRLEQVLREAEAEAKRPANRLRDWLQNHYPDWEQSFGRLLRPEVLDSRGLLPRLDRIHQQILGVELLLEELPEMIPEPRSSAPALKQQLAEFRQACAQGEVAHAKAEKQLDTRFKQKIRPVKRAWQDASYRCQQQELHIQKLETRLEKAQRSLIQEQEQRKLQQAFAWDRLQSEWAALLQESPGAGTQGEAEAGLVTQLDAYRQQLKQVQQTLRARSEMMTQRQAELAKTRERLEQLEAQLSELVQAIDPDMEASVFAPEEWLRRWQVMHAGLATLAQQRPAGMPPVDDPEATEGSPGMDGLRQLKGEHLTAERLALGKIHMELLQKLHARLLPLQKELLRLQQLEAAWQEIYQHLLGEVSPERPRLRWDQHGFADWMQRLDRFVEEVLPGLGDANLFASAAPDDAYGAAFDLLRDGLDWLSTWPEGQPYLPLLQLDLPARPANLPQPAHAAILAYSWQVAAADSRLQWPLILPQADQLPLALLQQWESQQRVPSLLGLSSWPVPMAGHQLWAETSAEEPTKVSVKALLPASQLA